jgi:hypothetical protein
MQARRRHNPQSAAPQGPQQGLLPIRAPIFEHAGAERWGTAGRDVDERLAQS